MIVSFRHKGLKQLFERGNRRGLNPQHVEKLETFSAYWMSPRGSRTWMAISKASGR